ncbi:hypothetical protein [Lactobacillus terrae]|uniref:hypothetical protein n=1 Tax=Lactobacillus terrae TaxID=2269374 RepID=UPI000C1B66F9|nr:hypothetical protein [Lactobacillus terrae]
MGKLNRFFIWDYEDVRVIYNFRENKFEGFNKPKTISKVYIYFICILGPISGALLLISSVRQLFEYGFGAMEPLIYREAYNSILIWTVITLVISGFLAQYSIEGIFERAGRSSQKIDENLVRNTLEDLNEKYSQYIPHYKRDGSMYRKTIITLIIPYSMLFLVILIIVYLIFHANMFGEFITDIFAMSLAWPLSFMAIMNEVMKLRVFRKFYKGKINY